MSKQVSFDEIKDFFCEFVDACGKVSFYTRSIRIQNEKIIECERYIQIIKSYKNQCAKLDSEYHANQLFHMQCVVNALRSSLLMWIELKSENYQKAWSHLIDAQEYIGIALKVADYEGIRNLKLRLQSAEESIFPGWTLFSSAGFTESIGKCSICLEEFSSCDHIENTIYMGRMCQRVDRKIIRADHFAVVKNPRDRRCIFTTYSDDDGNEIDYFTLENTGEKVDSTGGMHAKGILFTLPTLDVLD